MAALAIIGLSAKIAQGKDHMAKIISARFGFMRIAYGDNLKMVLIGRGEMTWEEAYITKPPWVRERLQQYGTEEIRDTVDIDFWVRALEGWVQTFHHFHGISKFIVPDIRFRNELDWVHENEGFVIRLDSDLSSEKTTPEQAAHSSEVLLDNYDFPHRIINNDGEAEEAEAAVAELVTMYLRSGATDGRIF